MRDHSVHHRTAEVERELARLADGTLQGSRRDRVEGLVTGSAELQARLREQRRAVAATRSVAQQERAPLALRVRRGALAARPRRRSPALAVAVAGAAGALLWTVTALGGAQAGLTVAQAATLAAQPSTIAVAEPRDDGVTLPRVRAAGLPFPYWEDRFHWRATGARTDRLGGRVETTVFYRRGARSVAYTIVSGHYLPDAAGARTMVRAGTVLTSFSADGRHVVTWLRRGHTCVLSSRDAPVDALLKLAAWRGHGRIPY
jgi:hypothetical protein